MQRAIKECPDKENLYPVQINSIKELQARWKGLRDTERAMQERLKKDVEEGEAMEREIDKVYFDRAMKCAKRQTEIITKYFKIMLQTNRLMEAMSENMVDGH